jgi:hypothetical protein
VLKKLGLLDFKKVQMPKYVIAKQIWPEIKSALESCRNLNEVISQMD